MKLVALTVLALVALSAAAPAEAPKKVVQILRSEFEQQPEGPYVYAYETDDGTNRSENGELKEVLDEDNKPQHVVVVRGQYSFVDPDGKTQTVTYWADETGFHAEGDSIPKPARR